MRKTWKHVPVRDSAYYQELLKILRKTATLLPFALILGGLLSKYGIQDGRFYAGDFWYIIITISLVITAITQYYFLQFKPYASVYLLFSVIYHVHAVIYTLFVTGLLVPSFMFWVILTLAVDVYFGAIAYWLSMLTLAGTVAASFALYPFLTPREKTISILFALFIGIIAYIISRLRSVNDRERLALIKTREQENFQRERLLALVNSMGDAVVTTTEQGSIKVYNAALLNLLDTNASLTGKNLDKVLKLANPHRKTVSIVSEAQSKHIVFSRTDLSHRFEEGELMKLYINVAPIRPDYQSRGERGFIFIMRDITKEKTLEEERDEFISVVSHELRTPVAIVEGNISNIKLLQSRGAAAEFIKHAVDDAHDQIMYLAKMVNDLGTLSRAERNVAGLLEDINLTNLLTELYKTYLPQAQKKQLLLDIDLDTTLPIARTNQLYLEEILQNFITNAIKYTKQGSVTIIGKRVKEGVYIAVKDTGIGIGKSDQKHIFEKFYRSEDYRTRESSGTGLGLYVSRKLADKLGLKLQFESRLNHGTTFSFVLNPGTIEPTQKKQ